MNCLVVRDRLPEYALDALEPGDVREVERHLESCAGCRKEAEELREGAVALAFDVPRVAPSEGLEARVIGRVVRATGTSRRSSSRRTVRVMAAAGLAAALVAAGSLSWAISTRNRVTVLQNEVNQRSTQVITLSKLIDELRKRQVVTGVVYGAQLAPATGPAGGGGAAVLVAQKDSQDLFFVDVNLAPTAEGPFKVLFQQDGTTSVAGSLVLNPDGDYVLKHSPKYFDRDLSGVSAILVVDRNGKTLLVGPVQPAGSPDPRPA